jgi:starch phosphorylase
MTNVQLNRPNPSNVSISPSELTAESIKHDILDHLYYSQARLPEIATRNDWYMSLALTVRDRILDHWIATARTVMRVMSVSCHISRPNFSLAHSSETI